MVWKKLKGLMFAALLALPLALAPPAQAEAEVDTDGWGTYYDDDVYDTLGWEGDEGFEVGDPLVDRYEYDENWFGGSWEFDDDDWWL